MEVKQFITRPDIMSIYEKEGVTEEVLASITEVAGYTFAKEKMKEESEEVVETPTENPTETPTETPEVNEPVEEPVEEPEIVVEETEE